MYSVVPRLGLGPGVPVPHLGAVQRHVFPGLQQPDTDVFPQFAEQRYFEMPGGPGAIDIATATIHTFLYTGITVVGILLISSLAAYEFTFYEFPMKKVLFGLLMVSMMLPQVLYIIPLYRMVFSMKLADTFAGISMPMMVSALSVFIMMQFLEDLPASFIESARIDGAGHFQIYRRIVLPLMRNGILTTVVLMFMKIWGQYLWPALVTGQKIKPISVTVANLLNPNFWVDPRVKIAAMLIAMIPPLLIYLIFQRYVIEGITMSGVKG